MENGKISPNFSKNVQVHMIEKPKAGPPNHNLILNELNRESILVFLRNNPPSPPPNTRDEDGNAYAAHFKNLAEGIKLNMN